MQVGFLGLLGLLFIGLKLAGAIEWAWIWVLAPFWIVALLIVAVVIIGVVYSIVTKRKVSFYLRKNK
jgi:hypothetical protein